jgi:hypothetical protein
MLKKRVILCIDLIIWYFRILHSLLIFPELGPKLVMIHKMLKDLALFLPIYLVFFLAYGITIHGFFQTHFFDLNIFWYIEYSFRLI